MKPAFILTILLLAFSAGHVSAEGYRKVITVYVENKSPFPNHVQVRDMEARDRFPEECRIAKKVAAECEGDRNKELRPRLREKMTCAAALALMEEPRCSIKGLIFDDWMDGGTKVELTIHLGADGFGIVGVRAVNNTESWTIKPGIRDDDTVGHQ